MIQASELRLGNWLYASGNTIETYQTSKPKQVTIEFLNAIKVENEERPDAFLTWFSPIPLTPEVLEKCHNVKRYVTKKPCYFIQIGFILFIELEACQNGMFCVYLVEKDKHETTITRVRTIEYLHQLQNLYFALTGEELEYKP